MQNVNVTTDVTEILPADLRAGANPVKYMFARLRRIFCRMGAVEMARENAGLRAANSELKRQIGDLTERLFHPRLRPGFHVPTVIFGVFKALEIKSSDVAGMDDEEVREFVERRLADRAARIVRARSGMHSNLN